MSWRWHRPAKPAGARLLQVETPIDENAGKPHLEWQLFAVGRDVREHLYECILHGLVGVVHVPEVLIRDPRRAPLQQRDEFCEPLARRVAFPGDERAP